MQLNEGEKIRYKGRVISIVHDDDPTNPRDISGNLGIIACANKYQAQVPHDEVFEEPIDWLKKKLNITKIMIARIAKEKSIHQLSYDMLQELEGRFFGIYYGTTLYRSKISGELSVSPHSEHHEDYQKVGYMYVSHEGIRSAFNVTECSRSVWEAVFRRFEYELEEVNYYVLKQCYKYVISSISPSGGGYLGDRGKAAALAEAMEIVDQMDSPIKHVIHSTTVKKGDENGT